MKLRITDSLLCWALILTLYNVQAAFDLEWRDDSDLHSFVTRPQIRAPMFNVSVYKPEQVVPGYWFLAPYISIIQRPQPAKYYQLCQSGPAIYDGNGELVWAGSCSLQNQNAFDFRAWRANDTDFLSMILSASPSHNDSKGRAITMDNSFEVLKEVHVPTTMPTFNMHEFRIIDEGKTALYIIRRTFAVDLDLYEREFDMTTALVVDLGFAEVDLETGKTLFEWYATDHISLDQSTAIEQDLAGPWPEGWNWIHLNSVDKNSDGDYLVSGRYTDSIYKVSGKTGKLLWTLHGRDAKFSSFELQGFNFSRQHDARFISQTDTEETISFLDNGGDEYTKSSNQSSALVVSLDKTNMVAKAIKRWIRPHERQSKLRGNLQLLPNGHAFTGWSDNCHITEHSWNGELLMEAEFSSKRFVTYRVWKANFTGNPLSIPDLESQANGPQPALSTTTAYISWNGATEVDSWNVYSVRGNQEVLIGNQKRTGFETAFHTVGYERQILVEALNSAGKVLGRSNEVFTTVPTHWKQLDDSILTSIQPKNAAKPDDTVISDNKPARIEEITEIHVHGVHTPKPEL